MIAVVVGGTGTLGTEIIKQLGSDHTIRVVSRDELKQKELRGKFPHINCYIGDIRDPASLVRPFHGADVVFHVAALKHVDVLEGNPEESVKTNILGTINVAKVAGELGVSHVVFSSTDKAVDPYNVYGMSKGISEKILFNMNRDESIKTRFSVFRWGNIATSRGAALHDFRKTLRQEKKVYITDKDMTRFWLKIEDAVAFLLANYKNAPLDRACIPPVRSASVLELVEAVAELEGVRLYEIEIIGTRPGEKTHEVLVSQHEDAVCSANYRKFSREELRNFISECCL
jgi:UDP-N-acetylglucosamine 4,6-dehydratase